MIHPFPILFAALQDVLGVLVTVAFFVIWVINQISDAKKKQAANPMQQEEPEPLQPAAANAGELPPPAEPLRVQVDEFLRRAAQAAQPKAAAPENSPPRQPSGRDEVVLLIDDQKPAAPQRRSWRDQTSSSSAAGPQRGRAAKTPQPPRERKSVASRRGASQKSSSVAQHVAERISSAQEDFNQEVADLGERVKQADEQFDRQLQRKFDHALGSLGERDRERASDQQPPAVPATTPAAQLATLLSTPNGVRQAILLNEILHRPTDRW